MSKIEKINRKSVKSTTVFLYDENGAILWSWESKALGAVDEMGLKTYVVVNLNQAGHARIVIINKNEKQVSKAIGTTNKSFIYDPCGSFTMYSTRNGTWTWNKALSDRESTFNIGCTKSVSTVLSKTITTYR